MSNSCRHFSLRSRVWCSRGRQRVALRNSAEKCEGHRPTIAARSLTLTFSRIALLEVRYRGRHRVAARTGGAAAAKPRGDPAAEFAGEGGVRRLVGGLVEGADVRQSAGGGVAAGQDRELRGGDGVFAAQSQSVRPSDCRDLRTAAAPVRPAGGSACARIPRSGTARPGRPGAGTAGRRRHLLRVTPSRRKRLEDELGSRRPSCGRPCVCSVPRDRSTPGPSAGPWFVAGPSGTCSTAAVIALADGGRRVGGAPRPAGRSARALRARLGAPRGATATACMPCTPRSTHGRCCG